MPTIVAHVWAIDFLLSPCSGARMTPLATPFRPPEHARLKKTIHYFTVHRTFELAARCSLAPPPLHASSLPSPPSVVRNVVMIPSDRAAALARGGGGLILLVVAAHLGDASRVRLVAGAGRRGGEGVASEAQ